MERMRFFICLSALVVKLILITFLGQQTCLAWDIPRNVPGDYEGKWYGIHCPLVSQEQMVGGRSGPAFPDQGIINAWGYKAKPIEEIKELLPDCYDIIFSNPELWGNFRINETKYIPKNQWPGAHIKLRNAATEKYKGQAFIDEYGHIRNHTAGIPFPGSTNAQEIIWNFFKARNFGDLLVARFYTGITNKKGRTKYNVSEINSLWWKGKLYEPDVPCIKPNSKNYSRLEAIGFMAPYKVKGRVVFKHRYDDPKKDDVHYVYLPFFRKYRKIVEKRWDKLPDGEDMTHDSINGFDGKPTNYKWKYLGRKLLFCGHNSTDRIMEIKGKLGGGGCDQTYQRVNCVMIQLTPKFTTSISRGVLYLDPDSYACYYAEYFDEKGRPYLFHSLQWVIQKSGCIGLVGYLVVDIKKVHSTSNYTYKACQNMDAVREGRTPSFFNETRLARNYNSR